VEPSELSWKRVNHPREVLRVGDEVKVYVLNVDRERRRIGLSLKRIQPDPWTLVDDKYDVDQLVEGVITKLAKFGAFACIVGDEEIEGLIHISELSEDHIAHPKEVVQEGQVVTLRIIRIDTDQRRMGLSLKRVDQAEYVDADWQAELEAVQEEAPSADAEDTSAMVDEGEAEPQVETVAAEASSEPETDASSELETDTSSELETDTSSELETDTSSELETDTSSEPETDASSELETDASSELATDASSEPETDTSSEPDMEAPAEMPQDEAIPLEEPVNEVDATGEDSVSEAAVEVVAE
jgi:ribosomal protein S1